MKIPAGDLRFPVEGLNVPVTALEEEWLASPINASGRSLVKSTPINYLSTLVNCQQIPAMETTFLATVTTPEFTVLPENA